jgi:hypothetical protein
VVVAVAATLTKGYDLEYIWKQVDRGPAKGAAGYYLRASEPAGNPPGRQAPRSSALSAARSLSGRGTLGSYDLQAPGSARPRRPLTPASSGMAGNSSSDRAMIRFRPRQPGRQ